MRSSGPIGTLTMSPYSRARRCSVPSGSRNTCNAMPRSGNPLGPGGTRFPLVDVLSCMLINFKFCERFLLFATRLTLLEFANLCSFGTASRIKWRSGQLTATQEELGTRWWFQDVSVRYSPRGFRGFRTARVARRERGYFLEGVV